VQTRTTTVPCGGDGGARTHSRGSSHGHRLRPRLEEVFTEDGDRHAKDQGVARVLPARAGRAARDVLPAPGHDGLGREGVSPKFYWLSTQPNVLDYREGGVVLDADEVDGPI